MRATDAAPVTRKVSVRGSCATVSDISASTVCCGGSDGEHCGAESRPGVAAWPWLEEESS